MHKRSQSKRFCIFKISCCSLKDCGGAIVPVSHCGVMSPVAFALVISCVNCIMYELSSEWFLLHLASDLASNCEMKKSGLLHSRIWFCLLAVSLRSLFIKFGGVGWLQAFSLASYQRWLWNQRVFLLFCVPFLVTDRTGLCSCNCHRSIASNNS